MHRTQPFRPVPWPVAVVAMAAIAFASAPVALAQPAAVSIATVDDRVLGTVLVDEDGSALYARTGETPSRILCRDACLAEWEPLMAPAGELRAPPHVLPDLSTFQRPDGITQVAYQDQPLYRLVVDEAGAPGGNGRAGAWFAANVTPVVHVLHLPGFGEVLVGPNGMTLYTFAHDPDGAYECDEACSENFPPLLVSRPGNAAGPPAHAAALSVVNRAPDSWRGARVQVTYEGRPLYYWSRDRAPGDVTGEGIAGLWRVARPGAAR